MAGSKKDLSGGNISTFSTSFLNPQMTNQNIVRASVNPLVYGTAKTVMDLIFSEPFFVNILDINEQVDEDKTVLIRKNLKKLGISSILRAGANDSLLFGNGISEWAWDQDPDTKYIMFNAASRRPPENFAKKKDNPASSALRWKGIYYTEDGEKGFDEAVKTERGTKIVTLDPEQIMCISSICEIAPDGPGMLEYLVSLLDGARYSWNKIFDVMDTQITPMDIITDNSIDGISIAKNYTEHQTSNDIVPRPSWIKVEHDDYPNKLDVIEFHKFFQNYILWVIFPTAVLNYDGSSALLDASSGKSKTDLLFSFINTLRDNIAIALEKKVELWLSLNGFDGTFSAQVVAPSTIPNDYQEAVAIARELSAAQAWTVDEIRDWANQFSSFELESLPEGGSSFVMGAAIDDDSKSKLDAMIATLLGESFSDAANDALIPLVKKIEKAGI